MNNMIGPSLFGIITGKNLYHKDKPIRKNKKKFKPKKLKKKLKLKALVETDFTHDLIDDEGVFVKDEVDEIEEDKHIEPTEEEKEEFK